MYRGNKWCPCDMIYYSNVIISMRTYTLSCKLFPYLDVDLQEDSWQFKFYLLSAMKPICYTQHSLIWNTGSRATPVLTLLSRSCIGRHHWSMLNTVFMVNVIITSMLPIIIIIIVVIHSVSPSKSLMQCTQILRI